MTDARIRQLARMALRQNWNRLVNEYVKDEDCDIELNHPCPFCGAMEKVYVRCSDGCPAQEPCFAIEESVESVLNTHLLLTMMADGVYWYPVTEED